MKASADLIVHAAERHLVERDRGHVQRMFLARSMVIAKKEIDAHAWWKFRRTSKPAFTGIEAASHRAIRDIQHGRLDVLSPIFPKRLLSELLPELLRILVDFRTPRLVGLRNRFEDAP